MCHTEQNFFIKEIEMIIEIDFNSDEAIYVQLCNQIILGIATSQFREGEQLPSVRQLAETIGINMHTVNKAYSILQQDGFVKIDRRRGAIIAIDINAHSIQLKVSDEELAERRKNWTPREPKIKTGYLARYASLVTSANRGAVLEIK